MLGAWDRGQQPLPCSSEPTAGPCSLSLPTGDQTRLKAVSSLSGLQSHGRPQPWLRRRREEEGGWESGRTQGTSAAGKKLSACDWAFTLREADDETGPSSSQRPQGLV